ncbi:MAG: hypothetical protein M9928_06755 [Anaerolineae bacterium]|nr:hypothetical protein [Anaerolineae bacterium]MCO5194397.1 hypothetical protein [Anaerolineae bacterium]MCO5198118.1 hypothetical protein [Anaerolineae bacterium]MCO5204711.1 hypothetical protein [Anaerolineae bacterium]
MTESDSAFYQLVATLLLMLDEYDLILHADFWTIYEELGPTVDSEWGEHEHLIVPAKLQPYMDGLFRVMSRKGLTVQLPDHLELEKKLKTLRNANFPFQDFLEEFDRVIIAQAGNDLEIWAFLGLVSNASRTVFDLVERKISTGTYTLSSDSLIATVCLGYSPLVLKELIKSSDLRLYAMDQWNTIGRKVVAELLESRF